jgi:ribosomal protein S18 acetylase RimI-like enzyme
MEIRDLDHERDAGACDAVLADLPEWFGDPQGIADCAAAVRSQDGLVAERNGDILAFLTWEPRGHTAAEITWMAVHAGKRRQGIGRALVGALIDRLRADGIHELRVKTLSSRMEYEPYAETRAFYRSNGFEEVEELDVWGPESPAVLLLKEL